MASARIIAAVVIVAVIDLGIVLKTSSALPTPDSAGIVEMINGLAYGGIPYGSVSGMLANPMPQNRDAYYAHNDVQQVAVLVPNGRTILQDTAQVAGPLNSIGY
ncbi:PREDICTED: uncharacterized protein LOC105369059 [Ceratosolen solmsi marchali]|uniref:Uncharacterized protein LOC105369059 n=1 Tax=Ceratosolen solmsi marchali TaxID=326594 RepID=A0AAJ7E3L9_9HYME|nr:PREDICTED: uncharacterized protein LOC105369059 [Ceratosolen solmsi marchali]